MRIGDPLTDNGGLSGNGTYYILRLNAPLETFLAEGTYTMQPGSDKYTEYTIPTDELSYVSHHGRTNYIKKGTMTVAYANELCDIEITLTATDNALNTRQAALGASHRTDCNRLPLPKPASEGLRTLPAAADNIGR